MARIMCDHCNGYIGEHDDGCLRRQHTNGDPACPCDLCRKPRTDTAHPIESGANVNVSAGEACIWSLWDREGLTQRRVDERELAILESAKARSTRWVRTGRKTDYNRETMRVRVDTWYRGFVSHEAAANATVETPIAPDPYFGHITCADCGAPVKLMDKEHSCPQSRARIDRETPMVRSREVIEEEVYSCPDCERLGHKIMNGHPSFAVTCAKHRAELQALDPNTGLPKAKLEHVASTSGGFTMIPPELTATPQDMIEPFPGYEKAKAESDALWAERTRRIYRQWTENQHRWARDSAIIPCRPAPADVTAAVAAEIANIAASRLADARLELWRAARRELAKRKDWLLCKDHDQPLAVYEIEDYVIRLRCPAKGCAEARCLSMDTPKRLRGFCVRVFDIASEHGGTKPE